METIYVAKSTYIFKRKRTHFAGGFAGSLARGGGSTVVVFSLGFSAAGETEAESLLEERLSFKSTEAVSEKPLLPPLPFSVNSP